MPSMGRLGHFRPSEGLDSAIGPEAATRQGLPVDIFNPALAVDTLSRRRARISVEADQGDFRVDRRPTARPGTAVPGKARHREQDRHCPKVSMPAHQNDFASAVPSPGRQSWPVWPAFQN